MASRLLDLMRQPSTADVMENYQEPGIGDNPMLQMIAQNAVRMASSPVVMGAADGVQNLQGLVQAMPQAAQQFGQDLSYAMTDGPAALIEAPLGSQMEQDTLSRMTRAAFDASGLTAGGASVVPRPAGSVNIFGLFGKSRGAGNGAKDLQEFVEWQRGRPGPAPRRADGTEMKAVDFDADALRTEAQRQSEVAKAFSENAVPPPRPRREQMPSESTGLPDDVAGYMTQGDRDAVLREASRNNRDRAIGGLPRSMPVDEATILEERRQRLSNPFDSGPSIDAASSPSVAQTPIQARPGAQMSPQASSPTAQPVAAPQPSPDSVPSRPSPIPQEPRYTKAHSEQALNAALKDPGLRQFLENLPTRTPGDADLSGAINMLQGQLRSAGLPIPSVENIERRLRGTLEELRRQRRAGNDLTKEATIRSAFGRGNRTLALPAIIAGGAAPEFEEALQGYLQIVRDMDGDGIPDDQQ